MKIHKTVFLIFLAAVFTVSAVMGIRYFGVIKSAVSYRISISTMSDGQLLSRIGMLHRRAAQDGRPVEKELEDLVVVAQRRGLSGSARVKEARGFLGKSQHSQQDASPAHAGTDIAPIDQFPELAKKRRSVRAFLDEKVPSDIITKIIECAVEAPSSCNRQSWRFLVIDEKDSIDFVLKWGKGYIRKAPVYICVLTDSSVYKGPQETEVQYMDGSAAIMNIIYAAQSFGLSSCWVSFSHPGAATGEFLSFFGLSDNLRPISFVMLGYGKEGVEKPKREPASYYTLGK